MRHLIEVCELLSELFNAMKEFTFKKIVRSKCNRVNPLLLSPLKLT